jgi:small subunit ribosomal protein S27Ae
MQLFVKLLDGRTVVVQLAGDATLADLQEQLVDELMVDPAEVGLVFGGQYLDEGLLEGQVEDEGTLYVSAALEGGKKKKKKKNYTTKKKNKHKHKKVPKLALSLYKVAGDGKATETHKLCPNCLHGIFLAKHWDRYYCGKCHTSIRLDEETIKANYEIIKAKEAKIAAEKKKAAADAADAKAGKKAKKEVKKKKK